ncbi:MAG: sugar ABC transporter permease, partial [Pseudarthrobacter sp.]
MRSPATARQLLRYLPVLPAVLLLLVFLAGPVLWAFHASLTDAGLTGRSARNPSWVGLENYQRLLTDPVFPLSVLLTVVFVAGSAVLGQNLLGLALAVLMRRARPLVSAVVGTTVVAAWVL